MKKYQALGMMSGSSLDGVDIAAADFLLDDQNQLQSWSLIAAETIAYNNAWIERLKTLPAASAKTYAQTHADLGALLGQMVRQFVEKHQLKPDLVASHGHTVFHHPESQMTAQIGDGAAIAAATGMQVVSDFRTQDLAKGGQGAPLAPLADRYLFPGYDFYLNLGGIANISSNTGSSFVAFDIGAANQLFNALAQRAGQAFDEGGKIAASGQLLPALLQTACQNPFYQLDYPKSLDNQWVQEEVIPLYLSTDAATADLMHTAVCQLAQLTAEAVQRIIEKEGLMPQKPYRMFSTGGGTLNNFLIQQIQSYCNEVVPLQLIVPKRSAIEFKEALLMALMGVFRIEHIPNCLSSVTGAKQSTIGGAIYQGSNQIPVYG